MTATRNSAHFPSWTCLLTAAALTCLTATTFAQDSLKTEKLSGEGVWTDPRFENVPARIQNLRVTVWFEDQFLGDGKAYARRAEEFSDAKRTELRTQVMQTLKQTSDRSWKAASEQVEGLVEDDHLSNVKRHWIINGFSCLVQRDSVEKLKEVPGVRKIFLAGGAGRTPQAGGEGEVFEASAATEFDAGQYLHPWYVKYLQANRVWKELKVTGEGTLNVIHDFNFVFSDNVTPALYRNPGETPGNGKDDDGNGLVDDYHGFDFSRGSSQLTHVNVAPGGASPQAMHGYMCAAIIAGRGAGEKKYEFGIAPRSNWTGVIAGQNLEAAVEWAIEQGADTYSMSFSMPGLADYRSHWRKVMEHGSFCGVCFVSGAGNFAPRVPIPVQMRTPEDIPEAVFAAAGVQRNFARTPFSSQGPVEWKTEHYNDGRVQKPEVCAFNMGLPLLKLDGTVLSSGLNGNSFAGPMFCGSIALMLSADPDLLPWDLKEIITSTATDVAAEGVDYQTGHGLINCYRAVREVLRRKAVREGRDASPWTGRTDGDELDIAAVQKRLSKQRLRVLRLQPNGQAAKLGLKAGDLITTYDGQEISSRADLQKARAGAADKETVPVVVLRGGEEEKFEFKPGVLGFIPSPEFAEPTFE